MSGHTKSQTIPAQLNCFTDYFATHSNLLFLPPPSLPLPTFFMDNYTPFSFSHGYIESNIFSFTNSQLSSIDAANLDTFHEPVPSMNCFDNVPPPAYPYTKALSSYSAVIQLNLHSGQLDTSLSCLVCLKNDHQPWCHFGCSVFEDPHHIFIICPKFNSLQTLCASELLSNIKQILEATSISVPDQIFIQEQVKCLFLDSNIWLSCRSLFYLGILPQLLPSMFQDSPIHTHISNMCHTTSIRLAGQIWGTVHCTYSKTNSNITTVRGLMSDPTRT